MRTIAFFNNKGGAGTTTLVHHLAWMYAELGCPVVAADLDPQANLSSAFLPEDRLEELWSDREHPNSILGAVAPALRRHGDIRKPHVEPIAANLGLVVGDLGLARFEPGLASAWTECLRGDELAFRAAAAFHHTILDAAQGHKADFVLMDVGPNLGAISRAAIIAANFVVFPLAPDLFSLQALHNVGPTFREWRKAWGDCLRCRPQMQDLQPPTAELRPAGYVVLRTAIRAGASGQACQRRWSERIPHAYRAEVLQETGSRPSSTEADPECLATLRHYPSLMAMAQEVRKPMFHLRPADGALGGHIHAVQDCFAEFRELARRIAVRCSATDPLADE